MNASDMPEPTYTVFDAGSHLPVRLVTGASEAARFAPDGEICRDPQTGHYCYLLCGAHKSLRSADNSAAKRHANGVA